MACVNLNFYAMGDTLNIKYQRDFNTLDMENYIWISTAHHFSFSLLNFLVVTMRGMYGAIVPTELL
jgi:hypothetical protein